MASVYFCAVLYICLNLELAACQLGMFFGRNEFHLPFENQQIPLPKATQIKKLLSRELNQTPDSNNGKLIFKNRDIPSTSNSVADYDFSGRPSNNKYQVVETNAEAGLNKQSPSKEFNTNYIKQSNQQEYIRKASKPLMFPDDSNSQQSLEDPVTKVTGLAGSPFTLSSLPLSTSIPESVTVNNNPRLPPASNIAKLGQFTLLNELSTLTPSNSVPELSSQNSNQQQLPGNNFPEFTSVNKLPELWPINQLPELTLVGPKSNSINDSLLQELTRVPTLPALTPAPTSETRSNFNFGTTEETCETVDQGVGSCVSLYDCPEYLQLVKLVPSVPLLGSFLRNAQCGVEGTNPKVCCPKQSPTTTTTTTTSTTTTTTTESPRPKPMPPRARDQIEFLEPPVCGFSNATLSRVVGGIDAKLGDFPWMAILGYRWRDTTTVNWECGGSLITAKHVLTAAHCIFGHERDLYVVRLGELDFADDNDGAAPIDVLISARIKHEDYSPNSVENDIGIVVLERAVQFTNMIHPICLPTSSELRANSFVNYTPILTGFGSKEFRGATTSHLQVVQLPVVSNGACAEDYKMYEPQVIDQRVLCAGYEEGGKDACQGDSGGPLQQPIWNRAEFTSYYYQIGVVSYGRRCADAHFPGVYTRVTYFIPWIQKTIIGK